MSSGTKRAWLAAAAIFATGWVGQASAESIALRIGAGHPATTTWIGAVNDIFMPRISERVAAETDYRIEWAPTWGGSVCRLNKDVWESLPEQVRNIIGEVGIEWNKLSGEFTADKMNEALEQMRSSGLRVKEMTADEKREWALRLPNIPRDRYEELISRGQPADAV